jgi:glycosyltransferase 2 family protein
MLASLWSGRLGRTIGWIAVGLSLAFIARQLWRDAPWDVAVAHPLSLSLAVAFGAVVYGMAGFLLAEAWRQILAAERPTVSVLAYHAVYGRTQIAKYLPGNIFHLAGRQTLGRGLGHSQASLAVASIVEAALLIAIASCLALPLALDRLVSTSLGAPLAAILALSAVVVGICGASHRHSRWLPGRFRAALGDPIRLSMSRLVRAAVLQTAFFVTSGVLLWFSSQAVGGAEPRSLPAGTAISALALAWVVGFVTPGSSAGIGVREALLIVILGSHLGSADSTIVALAMRVVTTVGDVIFFVAALALRPPDHPATAGAQSDNEEVKPG